jgi:hypothetical protein
VKIPAPWTNFSVGAMIQRKELQRRAAGAGRAGQPAPDGRSTCQNGHSAGQPRTTALDPKRSVGLSIYRHAILDNIRLGASWVVSSVLTSFLIGKRRTDEATK